MIRAVPAPWPFVAWYTSDPLFRPDERVHASGIDSLTHKSSRHLTIQRPLDLDNTLFIRLTATTHSFVRAITHYIVGKVNRLHEKKELRN